MQPTDHLSPAAIRPRNVPQDPAKVEAIRASLEESGWIGRPVVAIVAPGRRKAQALTGSHRIAAAAAAGVEVHAVLIRDGAALAAIRSSAGWSLTDEAPTNCYLIAQSLRLRGYRMLAALIMEG